MSCSRNLYHYGRNFVYSHNWLCNHYRLCSDTMPVTLDASYASHRLGIPHPCIPGLVLEQVPEKQPPLLQALVQQKFFVLAFDEPQYPKDEQPEDHRRQYIIVIAATIAISMSTTHLQNPLHLHLCSRVGLHNLRLQST